jgi:hypothetical protein
MRYAEGLAGLVRWPLLFFEQGKGDRLKGGIRFAVVPKRFPIVAKWLAK